MNKNKFNIGMLSYYKEDLYSDSDPHRERGNRRYLEFYNLIRKNKLNLEIYNFKNHAFYDLIIVKDIPRINSLIGILIKKILVKNIPYVLIIDETPIARNRLMLQIPYLFQKVCINTIDENFKFNFYETITYKQGSLPDKAALKKLKNVILKGDRTSNICFIGSNINSINKKSSYPKRQKLVSSLKKFSKEFKLYGKDWHRKQIPIDLPGIALINRFPFIKIIINYLLNLGHIPIISEGRIKSKIELMKRFDFALTMEPYLGKPRMILEKIFDPMMVGCIPVYYGPNINFGVPKGCFIAINEKTTGEELITTLRNISEEEKLKYRQNIYKYLISDKANDYRFENFANKMVDVLLEYKK